MGADRLWSIAKLLVSLACLGFSALFFVGPDAFDPGGLGPASFFLILAVIPWVFVQNPPARPVGLLMLLPTGKALFDAIDILLGGDRPLGRRCIEPNLPIKTQTFCKVLREIQFADPEVLIGLFLLALGVTGIWVCYNLVVKNSFGSWSPRLSPEQHRGLTGASDPVTLAIEKAEFYMAYGLKQEARQVIERALEEYPRDQRLLSKHHEVAS